MDGGSSVMRRRFEGTVTVATRVPCDTLKLATSPELPPSIYDPGEEIFSSADRDELRKALSFGLQSGWAPQPPQLEWGLSQTRYNRVEGFSTGLVLSSVLGRGYTGTLGARGPAAGRQPHSRHPPLRPDARTTAAG